MLTEEIGFFVLAAIMTISLISIGLTLKRLILSLQQIDLKISEVNDHLLQKNDIENDLTNRLNYIQQAKFAPQSKIHFKK
jgi:hypothetical protein